MKFPRLPERSEVFKDPKALITWMMVALILWLLIPLGAQIGIWIWAWQNPGYEPLLDPNSMPPTIWHGLIGMVAGAAVSIGICTKLRLGVVWLLVAILLSGLLYTIVPFSFGIVRTFLWAVAPPLIAAALLPPRSTE